LKQLEINILETAQHYGLPINPKRMLHSMSVGERQRVEIVRCLLQKPKLLIMDEPTSVLTPQAVQIFFETIQKLAQEGCSILYISHKLDEIRQLCDTATVLRAGKVTGYANPKQETAQTLAKLMIGSELPIIEQSPIETGETILEIMNLDLKTDDPFGVDLKK
jgi:simple sugar transport system ATP-binding protein